MPFGTLPRDLPGRIASGAFILNSGFSKREADEQTAKGLHGMASGTYPVLADQEPKTFTRRLSTGEIAVGALLLAPLVPTVVAGAALTAFSVGTLGLYLRTPGMHKEGSLAPTQDGLPIAKDVWMLGIGLGLLADGLGRLRRN